MFVAINYIRMFSPIFWGLKVPSHKPYVWAINKKIFSVHPNEHTCESSSDFYGECICSLGLQLYQSHSLN